MGRAEGEVRGSGSLGEETDGSHRYLVSADEYNRGVLMGSFEIFPLCSLILSMKPCRHFAKAIADGLIVSVVSLSSAKIGLARWFSVRARHGAANGTNFRAHNL